MARKNTEARITREFMKYYNTEGQTPGQRNRMGISGWLPLVEATRQAHSEEGQAGKAKKLALTACMRTLLTILNVMVKNRTRGV